MEQRFRWAPITGRRSRSGALAGIAIAAAAAMALAGCGSSPSSTQNQKNSSLSQLAAADLSVSQMVAGAKKEGKLSVYYADTGSPEIVKAFEKKYPFIHVQTYMAQGSDLLTHLKSDFQSGSGYPDVIVESDIEQALAMEAGYLQPYNVPSAAAYSGIYIKKTPAGLYEYVGQENGPLGFAWNTKMLPASDVPTTLDGLLSPSLKGKLAISGHSTGLDWIGELRASSSAGDSFVSKLAKNGVQVENVSGAALADLVASGAVVASPTVGVVDVIAQASKGAPIQFRFLDNDPSCATINGIAVVSKAPDPYAALLYTNFALSLEGQSTIKSVGWFSALKGAPQPNTAVSGISNWPQALAKADLVDPAHTWTADQYEAQFAEDQDLVTKEFVK